MDYIQLIFIVVILIVSFINLKPKKRMPASAKVINNVKSLISSNKIFIASKSYCPYCSATKRTFSSAVKDSKNVTIYELDEIEGGSEIQQALLEITGQSTVPNVFINGEHIGGNDAVQRLASTGELESKLKAAL
ncbi:glutaredoxin-2 [[Candida] jaroonii]|uniref:Glutaredoxin-2 n=1 Tax=[Candida] jaroonii TaxID=467808 RepID=A0ACA9Y1B7_9ASCO|nr:glutaredoxin-2 [[Candida] jaroonii]